MDAKRLQELANELNEATALVLELFFNPQEDTELKSSLASLWDACQDFQSAFENFSRE